LGCRYDCWAAVHDRTGSHWSGYPLLSPIQESGRESFLDESLGGGSHFDRDFDLHTFVSQFYGLVVVNDNGAAGSYKLRAGACTTPEVLTSGTPALRTGSVSYWSFTPNSTFWNAVGVRQINGNWDLDVWLSARAALGRLASRTCSPTRPARAPEPSISSSAISIHNSVGTYYVRPYYTSGGLVRVDH
jgi:hypothetical protein